MRLKRISKNLIFGGFTLFSLFYLSVNYVNLSTSSHQPVASIQQGLIDTVPSHHPEPGVYEASAKIEHRIRDYGGSDKDLLDPINVKNAAPNDDDARSKKPVRYYAYDGGGLGSFNLGMYKMRCHSIG